MLPHLMPVAPQATMTKASTDTGQVPQEWERRTVTGKHGVLRNEGVHHSAWFQLLISERTGWYFPVGPRGDPRAMETETKEGLQSLVTSLPSLFPGSCQLPAE